MKNTITKLFLCAVFVVLALFARQALAAKANPAFIIADSMCSKLTECYADFLDDRTCMQGVLESDNVLGEIGGPSTDGDEVGFYITVSALLQAGELTVNVNSLKACTDEIASLDCNTSYAISAWDPEYDPDFEGVENIFYYPEVPACENVFSK